MQCELALMRIVEVAWGWGRDEKTRINSMKKAPRRVLKRPLDAELAAGHFKLRRSRVKCSIGVE
jgi:hypothetical protein